MNPEEGFEATFVVAVDRQEAWHRLTDPAPDPERPDQLWLPGFDSSVTVIDAEPPGRLRVTKDDEPCAGTEIVVTLEDETTGTRIHVVQSRFGDWMAGLRETMAVGWLYITADLHVYLATGVRAGRFSRAWADLGADATAADGGIRVQNVRTDGPASQLGLAAGDLLLTLNDAPVTSLGDLAVALLAGGGPPRSATWIRSGALRTSE